MLRSGESCGFYKSSNGESYQNELTGVRNSFLTPVFEALKVQDQGLHRYPITAFMKTSALIRKNETTSKIQIPYIFKVALILFLNHLAINQNLRFYIYNKAQKRLVLLRAFEKLVFKRTREVCNLALYVF